MQDAHNREVGQGSDAQSLPDLCRDIFCIGQHACQQQHFSELHMTWTVHGMGCASPAEQSCYGRLSHD